MTPVKPLTDSDIPSLLSIVYKFGDWLITLLQIHILINSAIVGWILTTKPSWQIHQKGIVTIVYALAMAVNYVWMRRLHIWIMSIAQEIETILKKPEFETVKNRINTIISEITKERWWDMLFAFHVASDLVVAACILLLTGSGQ